MITSHRSATASPIDQQLKAFSERCHRIAVLSRAAANALGNDDRFDAALLIDIAAQAADLLASDLDAVEGEAA